MKNITFILLSTLLLIGCGDYDKEYTSFHEGNIEEWTPEKVFGGVATYKATKDAPIKLEDQTAEQKEILALINEYRTGVKKCDGKRYNYKPLTLGKEVSRFSDELAQIMIDGKFCLGTKKEDGEIANNALKNIKYYPNRYSAAFTFTPKNYNGTNSVFDDATWAVENMCHRYNKNAKYKWVGISLLDVDGDQAVAIVAAY